MRAKPICSSPKLDSKRALIQNMLADGVPRSEIARACGTTASYVDTVALGVTRCVTCPPRRCKGCGGKVRTIPCRLCAIRNGELLED